MTTPNNGIPYVPENTTDPAAGLNQSLLYLDALLQLLVETLGDTAPPVGPVGGQRHIVGVGATGAWAGQDDKLAVYDDVSLSWSFYTAHFALNKADGLIYGYVGTSWQVASGINTFAALNDTPAGFSGNANRLVAVTPAADGLEFIDVPLGWPVKQTPAVSAGSLTLDIDEPTGFVVTLDQDVTTLSLANASGADYATFALVMVQDATGGWTVTWPAAFKNSPEQPDPGINAITLMEFVTWDGGSSVYPLRRLVLDAGGVLASDTLYTVNAAGVAMALNSSSLTADWSNVDNGVAGFNASASNSTKVFAIDDNGVVWSFNKADGTQAYSSFDTLLGWGKGIACDESDNVYVVGLDVASVKKFNSAGVEQWAYVMPDDPATAYVDGGVGLVMDSNGDILACSSVPAVGINNVFKLDQAGTEIWTIANPVDGEVTAALAVDASDRVYVMYSGGAEAVLRRYPSTGGAADWTGLSGHHADAWRITVDAAGNTYGINNYWEGVDPDSGLLYVFDNTGVMTGKTEEVITGSQPMMDPDGVTLYVHEYNTGTSSYDLVAYTAATYTEVWRYDTTNDQIQGITF